MEAGVGLSGWGGIDRIGIKSQMGSRPVKMETQVAIASGEMYPE